MESTFVLCRSHNPQWTRSFEVINEGGNFLWLQSVSIFFINSRYEEENNPYNLWIPQDSDSVQNNKWLSENFPRDERFNNLLFTGDDILTPEVLKEVQKRAMQHQRDLFEFLVHNSPFLIRRCLEFTKKS